MAGRIYVRDLEILLSLQSELSKFNYGSNKVLSDVTHDLSKTKEFLHKRASYWNVEMQKRESALRSCLSNDDRERNCSAEAAAVRQATEAIAKIKALNSRLEQAEGEYLPNHNRLNQLVNGKISQAKGNLRRSIEKYQDYLAQVALSQRGSGYRTHNYEYQKERRKFILNTIKEHPALTNNGSHILGELETNIRQSEGKLYIRSPKEMHVGHNPKRPGWNHWSNFRWERAYDNVYRGGKHKR
jgi:hypothetical protein